MAFKPAVQNRDNNSQQEGDRPEIDYSALDQHKIDVCKTQDKHRTIPGYVSGYYDLGKQPQRPYETLYAESDPKFAEMQKDVEDGKATVRHGNIYISDNGSGQWHNDVDIFSKPRKPRNAIAWCVTFPQIIADIDPFFGNESNPRPFNVIMGGEQWLEKLDGQQGKEKCIQDVTFVQETTNNPSKTWGLGQTTNLHKMGSALGLLNEHNLLKADRLGEFLGQPLQFRLRIWNKPKKNGDGAWFTEELKFVSEVPEGLPVPEFDDSFVHGINFHEANDPETVKALSVRVVNTMKRALDFEGSVIQKELKEAGKLGGNSTPQQHSNSSEPKVQPDTNTKPNPEPQKPAQPVVEPPVVSEPSPIDFDDD